MRQMSREIERIGGSQRDGGDADGKASGIRLEREVEYGTPEQNAAVKGDCRGGPDGGRRGAA